MRKNDDFGQLYKRYASSISTETNLAKVVFSLKNNPETHQNASKLNDFAIFLNFIAFLRVEFEFWCFAQKVVLKVQNQKKSGVFLPLDDEASKFLRSFMSLGELTARGQEHIIDVANSAAMLDNCSTINGKHIIEAAECRLFDRGSWVRAINDSSLPNFNREEGHKLEPWLNNVSIQ